MLAPITLMHVSLIDREQLVQRHNVQVHAIDTASPLSVGNGEFAFTGDVTGLRACLPSVAPTRHELAAALSRPRFDSCTRRNAECYVSGTSAANHVALGLAHDPGVPGWRAAA